MSVALTDALLTKCDVTIKTLNELEDEVIAYIQKRRIEAQNIRSETLEKHVAYVQAKAIEDRRR